MTAVPDSLCQTLELNDNRITQMVYGVHDKNLVHIETTLGVTIINRGNRVTVTGDAVNVENACLALNRLYAEALDGKDITPAHVQAAIRMTAVPDFAEPIDGIAIKTRRGVITPRTPLQARYIRTMRHHHVTFGIGAAGTGKTYLGVCQAVECLIKGDVERIVLSRPAVEAGENLGFLPGDLQEKIAPYLRPLYDALYECLPAEQVASKITSGDIEIAPLAFMRGRTLKNAFVLLDEAQNTTPVQMKMFLTRLGYGSRMVVNGDLTQVDLPPHQKSGLRDALEAIGALKNIGIVRFTGADVVRHPLVSDIIAAYDSHHDRDVERHWATKKQRQNKDG